MQVKSIFYFSRFFFVLICFSSQEIRINLRWLRWVTSLRECLVNIYKIYLANKPQANMIQAQYVSNNSKHRQVLEIWPACQNRKESPKRLENYFVVGIWQNLIIVVGYYVWFIYGSLWQTCNSLSSSMLRDCTDCSSLLIAQFIPSLLVDPFCGAKNTEKIRFPGLV